MINSKILAQTLMKISKSENNEKTTKTFFDYLKKKNFLGLLPQIKKHIERYVEKSSQTNTLIISSKFDLSEEEIKEITSLVDADKNSIIEVIRDGAIVGGFSATYRGNIYDGSLRNQITQLSTKLSS